jgi:pimeloyl-ACP methyl ester carboxylesterase
MLRRGVVALLLVALLAACGARGPEPTGTTGASRSPAAAGPPSVVPGDAATGLLSPTPTPLAWTDCGGGFECARLEVPRDHADPSGPSLSLALVRLRASNANSRIGSLVVHPGGPGGSGVDFVRSTAAAFPAEVRARFDIVGFDPRGVGLSSPVLCHGDLAAFAGADADPRNAAELAQVAAIDADFARACGANAGPLLPYLTTDQGAQDLDAIRAALGDTTISYLGFSYGTFIGELYAARYPQRIRAMVLDAVVDPSLDLEGRLTGQAAGFEGALDRFLADCARRVSCVFHEGGASAAAFDQLMAGLDSRPLPTGPSGGNRLVGPGLAWEAILGALYTPRFGWPYLAATLALASRGNGLGFLAAADAATGRKPDGEYTNELEAQVATNCADLPAPSDPAAYARLADRLATSDPRVGRVVAMTGLACAAWPVRSGQQPAPVAAEGAPSILLVGATGDPATPYAWAKAVHNQLASSILLTRDGEGHASYLLGNRCVDGAVDAYLLDRRTPPEGTTCG